MIAEYRLAFLSGFGVEVSFMLVLDGSSFRAITLQLGCWGQPLSLAGPGHRRMTTSSRSCSLVAVAKRVRNRSIPTTSYPTDSARSAKSWPVRIIIRKYDA